VKTQYYQLFRTVLFKEKTMEKQQPAVWPLGVMGVCIVGSLYLAMSPHPWQWVAVGLTAVGLGVALWAVWQEYRRRNFDELLLMLCLIPLLVAGKLSILQTVQVLPRNYGLIWGTASLTVVILLVRWFAFPKPKEVKHEGD
jgi:hypothetical protein